METQPGRNIIEHTAGGGKPNRIASMRAEAGGDLTANDAYELDLWRSKVAEAKKTTDAISNSAEQPMVRDAIYSL